MGFKVVRELAETQRDNGLKRLSLALYESDQGARYIALAEHQRSSEDSPWQSNRKGVTVRKSELTTFINALRDAESIWDASGEDPSTMSPQVYAAKYLDWG